MFGGSVTQLFQQLINTTLCPAFLKKNSSVSLFAVYPFKYKLCQNLVLVAEYHVDC